MKFGTSDQFSQTSHLDLASDICNCIVLSLCDIVSNFYSQVKKLSFVFKYNPETVYLAEEVENATTFLTDTGHFRTSQVVPGFTYEVHGEPAARGSGVHLLPKQFSSPVAQPSTPYGSYTTPSFTSDPQPHPPRAPKQAIRKSVIGFTF